MAELDPFGREPRHERLSDRETTQRMLDVGVARVQGEGLRISFDQLRYEELITDANVARSTVYRRWPTKQHYYADLLRELAQSNYHATAAWQQSGPKVALDRADELLPQLATAAGRRAVAVELCRATSQSTAEILTTSNEWHTFLTLSATLAGLPTKVALQGDLQDAMGAAETRFHELSAQFYRATLDLIGFRLKPDLAPTTTIESVTRLGGAWLEGAALKAITNPDAWGRPTTSDPFGTGTQAEWTMVGLGFTALMLGVFEPDPEQAAEWDEEKIAACRAALESLRAVNDRDH
ncbi:hypothetical protein ACQB6R_12845 [Propionibacteriaceae bacterium G1746]